MRAPCSRLSAKHILLMGETVSLLGCDMTLSTCHQSTALSRATLNATWSSFTNLPLGQKNGIAFSRESRFLFFFLFFFFSFGCDPISFIDQGFLYGRCHSHFGRTRQQSNTLWVLLVGFDRNVLLVERDTYIEKQKIK